MNISQAQTEYFYNILNISHVETKYFYNIQNISQAQAAAADNPYDDPTETLPVLEAAGEGGEEGAGGETIQTNCEQLLL